MKHFFTIIIFLSTWHLSIAQTGIEGVFVFEGNDYYYELTLKSNFNYRMRAGTCIHHIFDTGTYLLQNDTLDLNSILTPEQLINKKVTIGMAYSPIDTGLIDTLEIGITNESDHIQYNLVIRDSTNILTKISLLEKGESKKFAIKLNKSAQTIGLFCSIGAWTKEIPSCNSVNLIIYTDRTYTNSQIKGRYLYNGDRIFWLDSILKKNISDKPFMIRQR